MTATTNEVLTKSNAMFHNRSRALHTIYRTHVQQTQAKKRFAPESSDPTKTYINMIYISLRNTIRFYIPGDSNNMFALADGQI